jgi:hypothetical protein
MRIGFGGELSVKSALFQKQFDLVILGSAKPDALQSFYSLLEWMRCPWVFIDGSDWQEMGGDFERLGGKECLAVFQQICREKKPTAIFKRELPLNHTLENVFPLPFSVHTNHIPILSPVEKTKFQVQFWAVESSPTRKQVFELLKGRYDCDENGSVGGQKFRTYSFHGEDYFQAVNQCRISLSFRGAGFDTLRYWEIPALGSLLISEQPTIQIPNNFIAGKHAVFCKNDLSDLQDKMDYYLAHPKERNEIALEGQKHLLKYHTHVHRAEYVLEHL